MKIANTSLERSASLVFIRKLSNKLNALQLHWRLPNSARNLAEAEFGKNGQISNLLKPKFGATLEITNSDVEHCMPPLPKWCFQHVIPLWHSTLTFWPQNLLCSSLAQNASMLAVGDEISLILFKIRSQKQRFRMNAQMKRYNTLCHQPHYMGKTHKKVTIHWPADR